MEKIKKWTKLHQFSNVEIKDSKVMIDGKESFTHSPSYIGDDLIGIHDNDKNILYSDFNDKPIATSEIDDIDLK